MTALDAPATQVAATGWLFAGVDVCREAGLGLPEGTRRPVFGDDLWDLAAVVGLPVSLALQRRRFNFAPIGDPRWRLDAKELVMALLAPGHEAVAALPRAYRAPLHVPRGTLRWRRSRPRTAGVGISRTHATRPREGGRRPAQIHRLLAHASAGTSAQVLPRI